MDVQFPPAAPTTQACLKEDLSETEYTRRRITQFELGFMTADERQLSGLNGDLI